MITEPELDGEWEPAGPPEAVQDTEVRGARAPRRPWQLIAAAVVATSALWAGGLYAFGDRMGEPEIRYRVTDDICGQFKAPALDGVLGGLSSVTPEKGSRHPALDWARCSRGSDRPAPTRNAHAMATVELHKKTDPAVEFALDTPISRRYGDEAGWESVPGLGQEAVVTAAGPGDDLQLRVRDGGAVFTVTVMVFEETSGSGTGAEVPPAPDRDALVAAAVEDARALMTALRKG